MGRRFKILDGALNYLRDGDDATDVTLPAGTPLRRFQEYRNKEQIGTMVANNISLLPIQSTGKLPDYTPPKTYSGSKGGGKSWGMSPDKKIEFIKKQLETDICHQDYKSGKTLAELTDRMLAEHSASPNFITIYFDILVAAIK